MHMNMSVSTYRLCHSKSRAWNIHCYQTHYWRGSCNDRQYMLVLESRYKLITSSIVDNSMWLPLVCVFSPIEVIFLRCEVLTVIIGVLNAHGYLNPFRTHSTQIFLLNTVPTIHNVLI